MRRLLDDYCGESLVSGGQGGDHPGSTAPDHDDVVLLTSHVEHVIELPGIQTTEAQSARLRKRAEDEGK